MVSWTQLRQGNVFSEVRILFQVEIRVRHREAEHVLQQQKWSRGPSGGIDTVKVIGSKEVGGVSGGVQRDEFG